MSTRLLVLGLCLWSCRAAPPRLSETDPSVARALSLARRFVAADTGRTIHQLWDSLWFPKEGMDYCAHGPDSYVIISSVQVSPVAKIGDTVLVTLSFDPLGVTTSEDEHRVGSRNVRFSRLHTRETDTLQVATDSSGRTRFVCDRYVVEANHWSVAQWMRYVPSLDSSGLAEWKAAQ